MSTAVATLSRHHPHHYQGHPQGQPEGQSPYDHHSHHHPGGTPNHRFAPSNAASPSSTTTATVNTATSFGPDGFPASPSTPLPPLAGRHHLPPFYQPAAAAARQAYASPTVDGQAHRSSAQRPRHNAPYHDVPGRPHRTSHSYYDQYPVEDTYAVDMEHQPSKKRRRSRGPDWQDFYRNGLPNEIIVIDDDTPQPEANTGRRVTNTNPVGAAGNSGTSNTIPSSATVPAPNASASASIQQPTKKRRREDDQNTSASNPGYHVQYVGSHTNTPAVSTISSDRTNSALNTTAPTSLSSNSQNDDSSLSLKRKRTRQQVANEAKRRDTVVLGSRYFTYKPPPFPPKKVAEVSVRSVVDPPTHQNIKVDDDDGHYIVVPDASLTERYQITRLLGQGTFGKVVQVHDRKRGKAVAVKIIRSVQKYRDASRIELRVLATLKANDDENRNRCIHLRDCFDYRGHICIVMDLLGQSVFDFLKGNGFVPFPNSQIQSFARQLFTSVAFLHDLNLIHTDLKPENILLCDHRYQTFTYNRRIPSSSTTINRSATQRRVLLDTEIRLIDFGSATFDDEYHSSVVSTRHYRAPEIILGLGWSYPCDIWSIGCILVEFFTGDALFQTHDNLEHLAMMEAVVGKRIDTHLVQNVNKGTGRSSSSSSSNGAAKYFKRLKLDYPNGETTRGSRRFVKAMKRLEEVIPPTNTFLRNFRDLLKKIFVYDPSMRITAREALNHPWFKEMPYNDDGTEAAKIRLEKMMRSQPSPYS